MLGLLLFLLATRPEPARPKPTWEPFLAPAVVVTAAPEGSDVEPVAEPAPTTRALPKLAPARTVSRPKATRRVRRP